jgi:ribonuclease E
MSAANLPTGKVTMSKEMLINTEAGQECRIAILKGGRLEELYIERASNASQVGNIYKGRVTNVEPSIQAAFIDFGGQKNGFLHITDVHPKHFKGNVDTSEPVGRKTPRRSRPPIQECLRRGQEVVVQMTKEGIGTKGPTLTTYLSIPGRLIVMMPGMSKLGVSRKIEDEDARTKARRALDDLKLPGDVGFIVRTAGVDKSKRELQRDLNYLLRLWKQVEKRIKKAKAPAEIYKESDLVIRTIRDVYNKDIDRIICDRLDVAEKVREFLRISVPRTKHKIELYTGQEGLFYDYGLEEEIERIYSRRVELNSGGSLVIDQTEALVAIDVNSGRFRQHSDAETTALKLNLEAADEILRQLRLRDLGGVIVIDFIDMRYDKSRRQVERAIRNGLKTDRAKTKVLRMSSFGIVELTRQRVRPSLKDSIYNRCRHCNGLGLIKSEESQSLMIMRQLQRMASHGDVSIIEVTVTPATAHHLANHHRLAIARLEKDSDRKIIVKGDPDLAGHEVEVRCINSRGSEVTVASGPKGKNPSRKVDTLSIDEYVKRKDQQGQKQEDKGPQDRAADSDDSSAKGRKKSRRSRRRKKGDQSGGERKDDSQQAKDSDQKSQQGKDHDDGKGGDAQKPSRKKRRRGRRGGRKHKKSSGNQQSSQNDPPKQQAQDPSGDQGKDQRPSGNKDGDGSGGDQQGGKADSGDSGKSEDKQDGSGGQKPRKPRKGRKPSRSKKDAGGDSGENSQDASDSKGLDKGQSKPKGRKRSKSSAKEDGSEGGDGSGKPKPKRRRRKSTKNKGDGNDDKND